MEFKKGDRVELIKDRAYATKGMTGTILEEKPNWGDYSVKFDKKFYGGNDLGGLCEKGYGYWIAPNEMKLIEAQSIHIYSNGNIITATLKEGKKTINQSKATCNPTDTFDFNIGAKLAFDRLFEDSEVREVERHAKVGEWVKVTNADWSGDCYKNDDILRVVEVLETGIYVKTEMTHPCCKRQDKIGQSYLDDCEYVVLENYKPTEEA